MLTRRIRIQLVVFVILGLVATTYLGAKYVGLNPLGSGFRVTVALPDAGGAFKNGEVTYRGVPVGRIKELRTTPDGMEADLHIAGDAPPIPADVEVRVVNRSAIGEQYIDLRGNSTDGKLLADGDRLVGDASSLPPPIEDVLRSGRDFAASVPEDSLSTVIDEFYNFSQGSAPNVARLIETSQQFVATADDNFLISSALIDSAQRVLTTQEQAASSITSFSKDLSLIATTLSDSDKDLRALIQNSPAAAQEIGRLFDQVGKPLGVLMGNLVSTAQVFGTNSAGVEDALFRVPEAVSIGWAVNGSKGLDLGLAQTYFDPLPCTSGYGGTTVRPGLDTSTGQPFNTSAGCSAAPSSGTNVRGPKSAPRSEAAVAARVSVPDSMGDLMGADR
jgi:phospholipid/cholesterol/gamma-HCH transport system substrate-binding protein